MSPTGYSGSVHGHHTQFHCGQRALHELVHGQGFHNLRGDQQGRNGRCFTQPHLLHPTPERHTCPALHRQLYGGPLPSFRDGRNLPELQSTSPLSHHATKPEWQQLLYEVDNLHKKPGRCYIDTFWDNCYSSQLQTHSYTYNTKHLYFIAPTGSWHVSMFSSLYHLILLPHLSHL